MIAPLACIIPAFNAERTLGAVIAGVRRCVPHALLIVVNDGSTDATSIVASAADVLISFPTNRGKGAALRAGFAEAVAHDVAAVVTVDADGQHDPSFIERLLAGLADAELAIGARARGGTSMPLRRRLTNAMSSGVASMLTGVRLDDLQCGFRAMRRDVLATVIADGDRYEFETDFLMRASRSGVRIVHVRVPTIYGTSSHFRAVRDTARIVRALWRHRARGASW